MKARHAYGRVTLWSAVRAYAGRYVSRYGAATVAVLGGVAFAAVVACTWGGAR